VWRTRALVVVLQSSQAAGKLQLAHLQRVRLGLWPLSEHHSQWLGLAHKIESQASRVAIELVAAGCRLQ